MKKTTLPPIMPGSVDRPIFTAQLPECQGAHLDVHLSPEKVGPEGEKWTPEVFVRMCTDRTSRTIASGFPHNSYWHVWTESGWVPRDRDEIIAEDANLLGGMAEAFVGVIEAETQRGKRLWVDVVSDEKHLQRAVNATRAFCKRMPREVTDIATPG